MIPAHLLKLFEISKRTDAARRLQRRRESNRRSAARNPRVRVKPREVELYPIEEPSAFEMELASIVKILPKGAWSMRA